MHVHIRFYLPRVLSSNKIKNVQSLTQLPKLRYSYLGRERKSFGTPLTIIQSLEVNFVEVKLNSVYADYR